MYIKKTERYVFSVFFLFLIFLCATDSNANPLSSLEQAIIDETNRLRASPKQYAKYLKTHSSYYDNLVLKIPGKTPEITKEGFKGLKKAIRHMNRRRPGPPLIYSAGLSQAARDHVNESGPGNIVGHQGADKSLPETRVKKYGEWEDGLAENIMYGEGSAEWVVRNLVINDGVRGKGHRRNILNPIYTRIGVACGEHKHYKQMCVMVYATDFEEY